MYQEYRCLSDCTLLSDIWALPGVPYHLQARQGRVGKPSTANVGIIELPDPWKGKNKSCLGENRFECVSAARLRTDRERQTDFAIVAALRPFASKNHTQVGKWTFHFTPAAVHPSKPSLWPCGLGVSCGNSELMLACWEGWGNTPGWRRVHTTHGRTNHLSFGKEWTMGREFPLTEQGAVAHQDHLGPAPHSPAWCSLQKCTPRELPMPQIFLGSRVLIKKKNQTTMWLPEDPSCKGLMKKSSRAFCSSTQIT